MLTDGSGAVIERYRYDAFGAPTIYSATWGSRSNTIYDNRFLFTGREYAATYRGIYNTPAFNFYEYRARAYNPTLGRFMSEDPKLFDAGDYNLFRYCHNDPVDFTDPMGLETNMALFSPLDNHNAVWERQMQFSSSMGAISYGMRAYAAEQAFKISVGIEATKRAEKATGRGEVPYSVATRRYGDTHKVVYSDPVPGVRASIRGGYREVIDTGPDKFSYFRENPQLWDASRWRLFVIGHTHPVSRSQAPGFSEADGKAQTRLLNGTGRAIPFFKNNPTWPGRVYDARDLGPSGWQTTHYFETGTVQSGPELD